MLGVDKSGRMIPGYLSGQKSNNEAIIGQESMSGLEWESQRVFLAVLRSGSLSGAANCILVSHAYKKLQ
ncbi:hypothetical protein NRB16_09100 [Pseudomonas sp. LJDD11]|uniref:hypothetical protein n=1 Tax=Pseudomonas sp. LJDD11 TaxID=2931984 RepID=UPI00211BCADC|nr:hypothetical protein [Pseudomonas sp. LJDD11]MCQ9423679.1 hypothetical protein [Pseudomonas sp. LJDD11]